MVVQVACGGPVACEVDTRSVHVEPGSPVGMIPAHTLGTCMYVASLLYHNWIQLRLQPNKEVGQLSTHCSPFPPTLSHTLLLYSPMHIHSNLCFYTPPPHALFVPSCSSFFTPPLPPLPFPPFSSLLSPSLGTRNQRRLQGAMQAQMTLSLPPLSLSPTLNPPHLTSLLGE